VDEGESKYAAAARELYEESSRLFDLRNSEAIKTRIAMSPRSDSGNGKVFHFRAEFDAEFAPENLIADYRRNRRRLGGSTEILDLAVEPITRLFDDKHHPQYPRLSQQTHDILSKFHVNLNNLPLIRLARWEAAGVVSYRDASDGAVLPAEPPAPHREIWHPLLTDPEAWER
jgi:hypothetical protein